jgi:hypothetical protein
MKRHSCVFCIFAPEKALEIAGRANPALLREYVGVEERIGHTFRHKTHLRVIQERIEANPTAKVESDDDGTWNM